MPKDITIFNYLNAINYKTEVEYNKKIAPAFLLSLWLSHDKELLPIINRVNEIHFSLPDHLIFRYYMEKIPRGKRFLKWTKKDTDKKQDKRLSEMLKEISMKYDISKAEFGKYKKLILKGHVIDKSKESSILVEDYFK